MTKVALGASSPPARAVKDESHPVDAQSIPAANDNEAAASAQAAANDNYAATAAQAAANEDDPATPTHLACGDNGIRVSDDLPRRLPVMPGEGEIVRRLLGERFRQILFGGNHD